MNPDTPQNYAEIIELFIDLLQLLLPILLVLGLIIFFWGISRFLYAGGSEDSVKSAKKLMLWGVIAFFVILSFMGILQFFSQDIFGTGISTPFLPTESSDIGNGTSPSVSNQNNQHTTGPGLPNCNEVPADQFGSVPCL